MPLRGDYGYDAPYALLTFAGVGVVGFATALLAWLAQSPRRVVLIALGYAVFFSANALSFLYTTRHGKFRAWETTLNELPLRGDERVLDLGCGRGAGWRSQTSATPAPTRAWSRGSARPTSPYAGWDGASGMAIPSPPPASC